MKRSANAVFTTIRLNENDPVPLYHQLYEALREAILTGQLVADSRLPSTRLLAEELNVSRNTVLTAFLQLYAEGYTNSRVGSGTYIASVMPDQLLAARPSPRPASADIAPKHPLSQRSQVLAQSASVLRRTMYDFSEEISAFQDGVPALDAFPTEIWGQMLTRCWRHSSTQMMSYKSPAGYPPLREAIAAYLGAARGVRCSPEQVIVVNGSQQAIAMVAQVLLDPGDAAWIEDPGYLGARGVLLNAGADLVPVPVDSEGLDVAAGMLRCPGARLAFVTPSHQFPLGVTMSLSRRLRLLDWAKRSGAWIVEDDYDSEFRYVSRPLVALQGLDTEGRVIYLGTFSKVLFPSLRLGYMVVPPDLVDVFTAARLMADLHSPILEQAIVADFITEGHFARHIRRMRTLYAERQAALVEAAGRELRGKLEVSPAEAGLHLIGWLPEGQDDRTAAARAAEQGMKTQPLSQYKIERGGKTGLLLGYAAVSSQNINAGVKRLAEALTPRDY